LEEFKYVPGSHEMVGAVVGADVGVLVGEGDGAMVGWLVVTNWHKHSRFCKDEYPEHV
jgi:hypothetical protein